MTKRMLIGLMVAVLLVSYADKAAADTPHDSSCDYAAKLYGIVPYVTFGYAPPSVQSWWVSNKCSTEWSITTGTACENMSVVYGVVPNQSWGGAPQEARTWWIENDCNVIPDLYSTNRYMDHCQEMADMFNISASIAWGYAPAFVQQAWQAYACGASAFRGESNCDTAIDQFGIEPSVSFGFAPDFVRTWWVQDDCALNK